MVCDAAAAAEPLQLRPTLCDPTDGGPPGPRPRDSPGKNTGVGCHFLLQCMKVKSEREVAQSCPTLSDPMDCSLPGSSVHGISQARVLEWGAIAFSSSLSSQLQVSYCCHSQTNELVTPHCLVGRTKGHCGCLLPNSHAHVLNKSQ